MEFAVVKLGQFFVGCSHKFTSQQLPIEFCKDVYICLLSSSEPLVMIFANTTILFAPKDEKSDQALVGEYFHIDWSQKVPQNFTLVRIEDIENSEMDIINKKTSEKSHAILKKYMEMYQTVQLMAEVEVIRL